MRPLDDEPPAHDTTGNFAVTTRQTMRGALFGLAAFAAFAVHDATIKYLGATYSILQIIFFASVFALPLTVALMRIEGVRSLRPHSPWWVALRSVASVVTGFSVMVAVTRVPLAEVYAIIFATPLAVAALAIPMLGEQVGWRRWLAIICGMIGVIVVLRPSTSHLGLGLGHLTALIAVGSGALVSTIVRKIGRTENNALMIFYPIALNAMISGTLLVTVYQPVAGADLALNAMISVLFILAMTCLYHAYRAAPAAIVAPMQYSQIIWATLIGAAVFGETLSSNVALGAGIIILSGGYVLMRNAGDPMGVDQ